MSEHITDSLRNMQLNADTSPEIQAAIEHLLCAMAPKGQETIYNTDNPFNEPPTPVVVALIEGLPPLAALIEPIIVPTEAAVIGAAEPRIKFKKLPTPLATRENTIGDFPVTGIIYGIRCIPTDKWYVGKTHSHTWNHAKYRPFGTRRRWLAHQSESLKANSKNEAPRLREALLLHGVDAFEAIDLEACDPADKNKREQYWIELKRSYIDGMNYTSGGDCGPVAAEHRSKIAAATLAIADKARIAKFAGKIIYSVKVTWHECVTNHYWVHCATVAGELLECRMYVSKTLTRVQLIAKVRDFVADISNETTKVDIKALETAQ